MLEAWQERNCGLLITQHKCCVIALIPSFGLALSAANC